MTLKVHANKAGYRELRILLRLSERRPQTENIIKLLGYFEYTGPNGVHLCLVIELMWMDVGNFICGQSDRPDVRTMVCKEVARQVWKCLKS
jgi:hypothetical protein